MIKKNNQITFGISTLIIGILLLGADRLFVSASTSTYAQSMTVLTTVSIFFLLVGAVVLFRTTFRK